MKAAVQKLYFVTRIRNIKTTSARFLKRSFCILLLLLSTANSGWSTVTIRVGGQQSLPKYGVTKDGKPDGVFGDVFSYIVSQEGWNVDYVSCFHSNCLSMLESGELDFVVSLVSTPERDKKYDFSTFALMTDWGQIFTTSAGPGMRIAPLAMSGKRVAIVRDSVYTAAFREIMAGFGKEPLYVEVDSDEDVLKVVDSGSADAGVLSYLHAMTNEWRYHASPSPFIFSPVKLRIAVLKGKNTLLLEKLDRHMRQLAGDTNSIYHLSIRKWMETPHKVPGMPHWLFVSLSSISAVALFTSLIAVILRRQVKRRTHELETEIVVRRQMEQSLHVRNEELALIEEELRQQLNEHMFTLEELQASKAKYKDIFTSSPIGIVQSTIDGTLLNVNPAFAHMFGYSSADEMLTATLLIDPLLRHELVQKTITARDYVPWELENYRKNNSRLITSGQMRAVRNEKGEVLYLEGFIIDGTERAIAQRALKESVENMKLYFQRLPLACVLWNQDFIVESWNPAAETIFGYSEQEIVGKVGYIFIHATKNNQQETALERVTAVWQRIQKGESTIRSVFENYTKDERTIICEWTETPMFDTNGNVCGVISMAQDITERKRVEDVMILSEKMMMIGGLAAGLAHEINNPMGIIVQNIQNIERRFSLELQANHATAEKIGITLEQVRSYINDREIFDFFTKIRNAGMRTSKIIANMLAFSRQSEPGRQLASMPELVEQSIDLAYRDYELRKVFNFNAVIIIRDFEADLPKVHVNTTEIEQVLVNLIKNAAQAMSGTTARPEIKISLIKGIKTMIIRVADNGPGMTEKVRKRIFEPFYTTKGVGVGTGLGLAVSYALITQRNNGILTVDSTPGQGCCFTIKLPLEVSQNSSGTFL